MIDKEKVSKNFKKFVTTGQKNGFVTEELIEDLGKDLLSAPASTSTDYFGAFEGGLIMESLNITKYAVELNKALPEEKLMEMTSILKVCLLHQIGKARLFKPQDSDWHKERGMMYKFNDDVISMSVGERSLFYATKHGVTFTEDEYQAILNYNKSSEDKQAKLHTNDLGQLLKAAIIMAGIEQNG